MNLLSLFEKGNYSQVIDSWNDEKFQISSDPNAAHIAAAAYFRLGDFEKACSICENIEGSFNNNPDFLSMYAVILRRLNLYSRAESIFQQALKISPNSKEIKNNYCNLMIDQGQYDQAIVMLKDIVNSFPHYSDAKVNLERAESIKAQVTVSNIDNTLTNDHSKNPQSDFLGDPLDKAFEVDEVSKCGAKLGSITASIGQILSAPQNKNIEQAELDMLHLANDQIKNHQYRGALEILEKIRKRTGIYASLYKSSSDALIGLERFKEAEIHALTAYINGENSIANLINLASLSAMRKDQLMARKWLTIAEDIDQSNHLISQCKELLFPQQKSRDIDCPFTLTK